MARSSTFEPLVFIDERDPLAESLYMDWPRAQALMIRDQRGLDEGLDLASTRGEGTLIVLQGDDAFVASAGAALERSGHTSLSLVPTPWPASSPLRQALGIEEQSMTRWLKALERAWAKGKLESHKIETLRVTSSAEPDAKLAFNLAAGQLFTLAQERQRSKLAAVSALAASIAASSASSAKPPIPRFVCDGQPQADQAYVIVSTLPKSWLNLAMTRRGGARYRQGQSLTLLLQDAARARLPLAALQGLDEAKPFEQLVFEGLEGYLLDGRLNSPGQAFILGVSLGPKLTLLTI